MSVSGFEDSIEVAGSQAATSTSSSLAASTASNASGHYSQQHPQLSSAGLLQQAHHAHAGVQQPQQPLSSSNQPERHPSLLHNVSGAGTGVITGYHSSLNQTQVLLQHHNTSSSHSSKRANR